MKADRLTQKIVEIYIMIYDKMSFISNDSAKSNYDLR